MSSPDPFLNLLKDFGYLPLRLPRADVQPPEDCDDGHRVGGRH